MPSEEKKKKSSDDPALNAIGDFASSISSGSDDLVGGLVAGVVVGGALYGGYHATKFTVEQAKKQSKHVKAGAGEVKKQAKRVVTTAEQATKQAEKLVSSVDDVKAHAGQLAKKVTRRNKKKDEPEKFPRL